MLRFVCDDGGKDKFVVFISVVGAADRLQSGGRKFSGSGVLTYNLIP